MILAIGYVDKKAGWQESLERSLTAADIPFIFRYCARFTWAGRVDFELEMARAYPSDQIVVVDPWDMAFCGTKESLQTVLDSHPLIFHAEKNCWPQESKARLHPLCGTPYRYTNGVIAGYGSEMAAAIEYGLRHFPIRGSSADFNEDNTNRFYMDVHLAGFGYLDVNCELYMPLAGYQLGDSEIVDGRLHNLLTGSWPCFVHANGLGAKRVFKGMMDTLSKESK